MLKGRGGAEIWPFLCHGKASWAVDQKRKGQNTKIKHQKETVVWNKPWGKATEESSPPLSDLVSLPCCSSQLIRKGWDLTLLISMHQVPPKAGREGISSSISAQKSSTWTENYCYIYFIYILPFPPVVNKAPYTFSLPPFIFKTILWGKFTLKVNDWAKLSQLAFLAKWTYESGSPRSQPSTLTAASCWVMLFYHLLNGGDSVLGTKQNSKIVTCLNNLHSHANGHKRNIAGRDTHISKKQAPRNLYTLFVRVT